MNTIKVTDIGDSINFVVPKSMLGRLQIEDGDSIQITETANGVELTAFDAELAGQLEVAKAVMVADREVLRRLAE
jgi:putative addiction module antidote